MLLAMLQRDQEFKFDLILSQAMGSIHGVLPGGKVITNVDVFRKLYEVVGLGWVYSITKFAPINKIANRYMFSHLTAVSLPRAIVMHLFFTAPWCVALLAHAEFLAESGVSISGHASHEGHATCNLSCLQCWLRSKRFTQRQCMWYRVYAVWAKYRLPLTGRPDLEVVLRDKQAKCKPASSQQS